MALTQFQLKSLRYDLQELAHIDNTDVLNDLLDHYAALTEQKMATGLSFDDASKWAWLTLGSGRGLQHIQTTYERNTRRQLIARHFAMLTSYFRWPAILVTLFGNVLIYELSVMLTALAAGIMFAIILFSPCLALLYVFVGWGREHDNSQRLTWRYLQQYANVPIAIINLVNLLSNDPHKTYALIHPMLMTFFCVVFLLLTVSLLQLSREQFRYKPA